MQLDFLTLPLEERGLYFNRPLNAVDYCRQSSKKISGSAGFSACCSNHASGVCSFSKGVRRSQSIRRNCAVFRGHRPLALARLSRALDIELLPSVSRNQATHG